MFLQRGNDMICSGWRWKKRRSGWPFVGSEKECVKYAEVMGCRWMGVVEGECRLRREVINIIEGVSQGLIRKDRR